MTSPVWSLHNNSYDDLDESTTEFPMGPTNIDYALQILDPARRKLKSRDRQVFSSLIELYSKHEHLLANLSNVLTFMCRLQPPEFVFVSFSVELDRFVRRKQQQQQQQQTSNNTDEVATTNATSQLLNFASAFVQYMSHVLLNAKETRILRDALRDCLCQDPVSEVDRYRTRLFHILLYSFAHNIPATVALCLWSGAYRTASQLLMGINPLDIHLVFLLEMDRVVELLERPFFR